MFERPPKPGDKGVMPVGENDGPFNTQLKQALAAAFPEQREEQGEVLTINTSGPQKRALNTEFEALQAGADAWEEEVVDIDAMASRPSRRLSVVSAESTPAPEPDASLLEAELQQAEEEPVDAIAGRILGQVHALRRQTEVIEKQRPSFTIEAGMLGITIDELSHESLDLLQQTVGEHFEHIRTYRGIPGTIRIDVDRAYDALEQEITAIQTSLAGSWDSTEMSKSIRTLNETIASFVNAKEVLERYRASIEENPELAPSPDDALNEGGNDGEGVVAQAYELRDSHLTNLEHYEAVVAATANVVAEGRRADEDRKRFGVLARKFKTLIERPFVEAGSDTEVVTYNDAERLQLKAMNDELKTLIATIQRREGITEDSGEDIILDETLNPKEVVDELTAYEVPSPEVLKQEYLPQIETFLDSLERSKSSVVEKYYQAKKRVDFKDGAQRLESLLSALDENTLSSERVAEIQALWESLKVLHADIMKIEAHSASVKPEDAETTAPAIEATAVESAHTLTTRIVLEDLKTLDEHLARSARYKGERPLAEQERMVYEAARQALQEAASKTHPDTPLSPEARVHFEQLYREAHMAFKEVAKHEPGSKLEAEVREAEARESVATLDAVPQAIESSKTGESELTEVVPDTYTARPRSIDVMATEVSEDVPGLETMPQLSEQAEVIFDEILGRLPGGGKNSKIWNGGWITRGIKDMRVHDFLSARPNQDAIRLWLDTLVDEAYPHAPHIEEGMQLDEFVHKLSFSIARARNQDMAGAAIAKERDV